MRTWSVEKGLRRSVEKGLRRSVEKGLRRSVEKGLRRSVEKEKDCLSLHSVMVTIHM